jgi:hypothetical protein
MRPRILYQVLLGLLFLAVSGRTFGFTNYVRSGSFEGDAWPYDWSFCCTVYQDPAYMYTPPRHPDGHVHLGINSLLSQEVETVAGREYLLQFFATSVPQVTFGDFVVQDFTVSPRDYLGFEKISCTVTAQTTLTHLEFHVIDIGFDIDDIRLGWLFEPLRIVEQPRSLSAVESANAAFRVIADGGPPISYQWKFNGDSIAMATNSSLFLTNVASVNIGDYAVSVSNRTGVTITSDTAHLSIDPLPKDPVILSQPASDTFLAGYGVSLGVVALGAPPLSYQWRFNGSELPGQTNSSLVLASIDPTKEGIYQVLVRNSSASVLSLPATLTVTNPPNAGGGSIKVANRDVNAPVYDVDGMTLLGSTNFVEQTYVGSSPEILRPLGPTGRFRTNSALRGFFTLANFLQVPDVPPGSNAYVQARVWDSFYGATYEEARARGGKYGASPTAIAPTSPNIFSIPQAVPLQTFALKAGLPELANGRLEKGAEGPNHQINWNLVGNPGFTYLVEKREPPHNWIPLAVVTNITGVISFTDPEASNASVKFYRARMLD